MPPLFTINGCGFKLYSLFDNHSPTIYDYPFRYNSPNKPYYATYYFTLLFIPIIPLARYLVARDDSTFTFFKKVPLRKFDKYHILVSVSLIFFIFVCPDFKPVTRQIEYATPIHRVTASNSAKEAGVEYDQYNIYTKKADGHFYVDAKINEEKIIFTG